MADILSEPVAHDKSKGPLHLFNSPELDHRCPLCRAEPGYLCRYIAGHWVGQQSMVFHRRRTVLTTTPEEG
jgi:hypothetical protein